MSYYDPMQNLDEMLNSDADLFDFVGRTASNIEETSILKSRVNFYRLEKLINDMCVKMLVLKQVDFRGVPPIISDWLLDDYYFDVVDRLRVMHHNLDALVDLHKTAKARYDSLDALEAINAMLPTR